MPRFELALFAPGTAKIVIPCREFLARRAAGALDWAPSSDDATFLLEAQGREWIADEWNLGSLRLLVLQLEDSLRRLRGRSAGLIRSGVLDQSPVPSLLLECSVDDPGLALLSLFCITDSQWGDVFPIPGWGGEPELLFQYVREHRESLGATPGCAGFQRLPFPYEALLEALARESAAGRAVLEVLNEPLPS